LRWTIQSGIARLEHHAMGYSGGNDSLILTPDWQSRNTKQGKASD
jgi:hypothetical protein